MVHSPDYQEFWISDESNDKVRQPTNIPHVITNVPGPIGKGLDVHFATMVRRSEQAKANRIRKPHEAYQEKWQKICDLNEYAVTQWAPLDQTAGIIALWWQRAMLPYFAGPAFDPVWDCYSATGKIKFYPFRRAVKAMNNPLLQTDGQIRHAQYFIEALGKVDRDKNPIVFGKYVFGGGHNVQGDENIRDLFLYLYNDCCLSPNSCTGQRSNRWFSGVLFFDSETSPLAFRQELVRRFGVVFEHQFGEYYSAETFKKYFAEIQLRTHHTLNSNCVLKRFMGGDDIRSYMLIVLTDIFQITVDDLLDEEFFLD